MGTALGIARTRGFVVKREARTGPGRFLVMDAADGPLFTLVNEAPRPAATFWMGRRPPRRPAGFGVGQAQPWGLVDLQGASQGTLVVERSGVSLHATLVDPSNAPVLTVLVQAEGFGGYAATMALPSGTVLLTASGKLYHGEQAIVGPAGTMAARMHRPTLSVGETFSVDLLGDAEPLGPLLLAFLLDRESRSGSGVPHPEHPGPAAHRR